ncbi:hypothetical protein C8Q74DRAFT_1215798 [Fomes fomentarius]|nr:hypothetical protein C8Q74DRAFT_1215798 [Fomes fomentarius]
MYIIPESGPLIDTTHIILTERSYNIHSGILSDHTILIKPLCHPTRPLPVIIQLCIFQESVHVTLHPELIDTLGHHAQVVSVSPIVLPDMLTGAGPPAEHDVRDRGGLGILGSRHYIEGPHFSVMSLEPETGQDDSRSGDVDRQKQSPAALDIPRNAITSLGLDVVTRAVDVIPPAPQDPVARAGFGPHSALEMHSFVAACLHLNKAISRRLTTMLGEKDLPLHRVTPGNENIEDTENVSVDNEAPEAVRHHQDQSLLQQDTRMWLAAAVDESAGVALVRAALSVGDEDMDNGGPATSPFQAAGSILTIHRLLRSTPTYTAPTVILLYGGVAFEQTMTTADTPNVADIISEYAGLTVLKDCNIACTSLIFYEYCITFDQEYILFWKRKRNGVSILYFLNRYFYLVYTVFHEANYVTMSDRSCSFVARVDFGLNMFAYLIWAGTSLSNSQYPSIAAGLKHLFIVFSGLRASTLKRSLALGIVVFLLSIVPIGINLSQFGNGLSGAVVQATGCQGVDNTSLSVFKICTSSQPNLLNYANCIRTLRCDRVLHLSDDCGYAPDLDHMVHIPSTIQGRMVTTEDDVHKCSVARCVLLLLNTLHLVLTMLSYHPATQNASYVTLFTELVTAILVLRFLLDLQAAERTARDLSLSEDEVRADEVSSSSGLVFEQIVGSLTSTAMSFGGSEDLPHVDIVDSVPLDDIQLVEKQSQVN